MSEANPTVPASPPTPNPGDLVILLSMDGYTFATFKAAASPTWWEVNPLGSPEVRGWPSDQCLAIIPATWSRTPAPPPIKQPDNVRAVDPVGDVRRQRLLARCQELLMDESLRRASGLTLEQVYELARESGLSEYLILPQQAQA